MSDMRLALSFDEGQALRELVLGEFPAQETRLLAVLQNGLLLQALRTDTGPLPDLPAELHVADPRELRELDAAKGVDRVVTLDVGCAGRESLDRVWEGVLDGSLRADPPWIPVLERVRGWPAALRAGLRRFFEDGVYALFLQENEEQAPTFVCARLRAGSVTELGGVEAIGADASAATVEALVPAIDERVGRLRLLIAGSSSALARVLADPHPASALEHASIRGQLRIVRVSPLIRAALFLARVLGL